MLIDKNSKKGFALITMFGIFLIIVLLVIAITQGITVYSSITERMIRRARARYLAEAGIHDAMLKMYFRNQLGWVPKAGTTTPSYSINIQTNPNNANETQKVDIYITETSPGSGRFLIKATAPLY